VIDVLLARLDALLDAEIAALRGHTSFDLRASNQRKGQVLVELTRASPDIRPEHIGEAIRVRLGALRDKLEVNARLLEAHVRAAEQLGEVIADVIRDQDWDGTYRPR